MSETEVVTVVVAIVIVALVARRVAGWWAVVRLARRFTSDVPVTRSSTVGDDGVR